VLAAIKTTHAPPTPAVGNHRRNDECGMMNDELKGRPLFLIHHSSFRIHHFP
jgi:hypothetical protein